MAEIRIDLQPDKRRFGGYSWLLEFFPGSIRKLTRLVRKMIINAGFGQAYL
jgi:hypothetical protein